MIDFKGIQIGRDLNNIIVGDKIVSLDNYWRDDRAFGGARYKTDFTVGGERFIIKFGYQSIREVDLYNILPEEDKPHFAPIITYVDESMEGDDYCFIVQPFLTLEDATEMGNTSPRLGSLWDSIIEPIARKYQLTVDLTPYKNWGFAEELQRPVIYDYAFNNAPYRD